MTEASDRDVDPQRDGASRSDAPTVARSRPPSPAELRARGWRREDVPSETVGTGSFFALGCTVVTVACVGLGVVIFLVLRWL